MGEIDYTEIQNVLDEILGNGMDFGQMVRRGADGEGLLSWKQLLFWVQDIFLKELWQQKQLWVHILILSIAAAVLIHFADVFQNRSVSQISFCIIYMMLFLILAASFQNSLFIARQVMKQMRDFMTVLAPAYLLALTLTSYLTTAGIYYEFFLLLISGLRWFTEVFILPCIEVYVLLILVNHMTGESRLSKLADLAELTVGWGLKAVLAGVCGFHVIQGLVSPAADAFRKSAVSKGLEAVPVIGDAGGSVTDMVLGSAVLIKNGIGATALVALILLCMVPLVKLAVIMAAYYVLAAVLQPVSDERITGCLTGMGNGVRLLLQAVFTVLALFFLTIALVTAFTGR